MLTKLFQALCKHALPLSSPLARYSLLKLKMFLSNKSLIKNRPFPLRTYFPYKKATLMSPPLDTVLVTKGSYFKNCMKYIFFLYHLSPMSIITKSPVYLENKEFQPKKFLHFLRFFEASETHKAQLPLKQETETTRAREQHVDRSNTAATTDKC